MLHTIFNNCDYKELLYIPYGADKGDCPYCFYGVLRREEEVEIKYKVKEGYMCPTCGAQFTEFFKRNFRRIAVKQSIRQRKEFKDL